MDTVEWAVPIATVVQGEKKPTPPPPPPGGGYGGHGTLSIVARRPGIRPTTTRVAMAGLSSRPYGAPAPHTALGAAPRWYREQLGSLGDDTASSPDLAAPTLADPQWQADMLSATQQIVKLQQDQVAKDRWIRYAQIAATLSIPLAAAVWKAIFRGGRNE